VKSILFWLIFLGIIVFSVHYYLQQHKQVAERLRRFPLLRGFWQALVGLKNWFLGVNSNVAASIQTGWKRLVNSRKAGLPSASWGYVNLRRLSPREKVIFFYMAMIRRGGEQGLARRPDQTPLEYSKTLRARLPEVGAEVDSLTDQFMEARYSRHEIQADQAGRVRQYWERIKRAMRSIWSPEV
jgi:hypothetical protein